MHYSPNPFDQICFSSDKLSVVKAEECERLLAIMYVPFQHFLTSNTFLISIFCALHLNYLPLPLNKITIDKTVLYHTSSLITNANLY